MVTIAGAREGHPDRPLVGVIGSPIAHSLSPVLHAAAFAALGLDWLSLPFEVPPGAAGEALDDMRRHNVVGLSVTMPHKAAVADLVDTCSAVARRLGAVNCIVNDHGTLHGENTDGAGFVAALARAVGFDPRDRRCLVIGAGGAARAVVLALAEAGAAEVAVVNRTADRAREAVLLAGTAGSMVEVAEREAVAAHADLVVNATPVGMAGADTGSAASLVSPTVLHRGQIAADLVYVPRPTAWLTAAADAGATAVDGLGMLVHQAAVQVELWTGVPPPVDAMWKAASHAI